MMELLVFLVILFGLIGVVATQYISQYRSAYYLWVKEKIFKGETIVDAEKFDLCSKIESYSRELCEINDLLCVLIFMIYITLGVIIVSIVSTIYYMNINVLNFLNLTNTENLHSFGATEEVTEPAPSPIIPTLALF